MKGVVGSGGGVEQEGPFFAVPVPFAGAVTSMSVHCPRA